MDPLVVASIIWNSSNVPRLILEMSFNFLLRRVDWFQAFNETVLYSVLYAFARSSVLSAIHLFVYECFIMVAVYWNPYKFIFTLFPDFIVLIVPETIQLFTEEALEFIDIMIVEIFWRNLRANLGYRRRFRFKHKTLLLFFTTYITLGPPSLVSVCYIFTVVYNYLFHFKIKTVHDIILFFIMGIIFQATDKRPSGFYMYLYVFNCCSLTLAWFGFKLPYMVTSREKQHLSRLERRLERLIFVEIA